MLLKPARLIFLLVSQKCRSARPVFCVLRFVFCWSLCACRSSSFAAREICWKIWPVTRPLTRCCSCCCCTHALRFAFLTFSRSSAFNTHSHWNTLLVIGATLHSPFSSLLLASSPSLLTRRAFHPILAHVAVDTSNDCLLPKHSSFVFLLFSSSSSSQRAFSITFKARKGSAQLRPL